MAGAVALVALLPLSGREPVAAQTPSPSTTAAPSGPTVRFPFPRDDGSLTPYSFQLGYPLMNLVYDTLLWRDKDGVARPWLARELVTSPDATRFTLRLHPTARWHDGTPLTAEDVKFTFSYVATRPSPRFTAQVAQVANVTVSDPTTVVITTRRPSPGFADQTLADLPIMPAHLWRGLAAGQDTPPGLAVGSGPYRLVERLPEGGYRLEANPTYFKGPPHVARVEVPIISELGATLDAFRDRDVDMVPLRLPPGEVRAVDDPSARVARGPSYWGVQLVFNLRQAPFNDPAMRQAVGKAIDLERITRAVGDATAAERGMIHPDSPWASPQPLKLTDEAGAKVTLAPLAQQPIEVVTSDNDPVHIETARQVALALQRAGLQATSTKRPVAELNRSLGADGAPPSFTLAVTTLGPASSYDPDFLARLFASSTATTSGYESAAFDTLADRVATTVDPAARRAATAEELRLLANDLPALPLLFPNGAFAYRPSTHEGWQYVRGIGLLDKQSFLTAGGGANGGAEGGTPTTVGDPGVAAPAQSPNGDGGGLSDWIVPLVFVGAGLALIVFAIIRSRT
jgi:peptide/nickel transport system substrate-binding protein